MLRGIAIFFILVFFLIGCVSTGQPATSTPPPPTLPIATGIPVTPTTNATRAAQTAAPTATVETLPTPENTSAMFQPLADLFKTYQPPDSDPKPLYNALANGVTQFLTATSNSDVSLEGQP